MITLLQPDQYAGGLNGAIDAIIRDYNLPQDSDLFIDAVITPVLPQIPNAADGQQNYQCSIYIF